MTFTSIPAAGAQLRGSTLNALLTELRPVWARKTSNQNLTTSSTTLQNVTELSVSVAASTTYLGLLLLGAQLSSGTTEDLQIAMTWPTGASVDSFTGNLVLAATTISSDYEMVYHPTHTSGVTMTNVGLNSVLPTWSEIWFYISTGANAGTLQVQAAQQTSGGNTVSVKAGSLLRLEQVT